MPSSERVRLADGAEVAGRFRIRSMLAEGRFGVVYSAEMLNGGASVMLKIIGTEAQIGAEDLARIRQEAELLAVLRHPHIVKIVDFGLTDEGNDYLAFEQLHGRTLQQAVADGPHPGSFVGTVALQMLDALELVHSRGIVHRAISGSNIFLCEGGEGESAAAFVKLSGFERAHVIGGSSSQRSPNLTASGQGVAGPGGMTPTQAQGPAVTPATDIFALGVVMAEALCGRPLMGASGEVETLLAQGQEPSVTLPPEVLGSPLAAIITRAVGPPGERWPNAGPMREALDRVVNRSKKFGTGSTTADTVGHESDQPSPTSSGAFDPRALAPGTVFHDSYEIVRRIGAGGMGAVYEVLHATTNRRRALKVMLPEVVGDDDMRARFKLEATVCAQVTSDHIAEILDAGVDEATGIPFIVMELLTGHELGDLLHSGDPLSYQDVVELLYQAALGLERTHAQRIVHRDLKPANLFVTRRDDGSACVKILDFGVAKIVSATMSEAQRTRTLGSPLYMAPEQIAGEGVDRPSDLYALAHIAFTLLAGDAYWAHTFSEVGGVYPVLVQIMKGMPEPASVRSQRIGGAPLPPAFDAWFARAAALDPIHRFSGAAEQILALADALGVVRPASSVSGSHMPVLSAATSSTATPTVDLPAGASTTSALITEGMSAPPTRSGWRLPAAMTLTAAVTAALAFGWHMHASSTPSPAGAGEAASSAAQPIRESPSAAEKKAPSATPSASAAPSAIAAASASAQAAASSASPAASASAKPTPQPRRPARTFRPSRDSDPLDTF